MTYRDWNRAASRTNYKRRWEASQRALTQALHENHVRDECLAITTRALNWYSHNCPLLRHTAGGALTEIERLLAELEPEEEAG